MRQNHIRTQDIAAVAAILAILLLNLWKAHYGFPARDETFVISLAHRFWQGDLPVFQEWNNSQFSAILMLPFFSLIVKFNGGMEGIVLASRILYVILNCCIAVFLYLKTRKYGPASIAAASIFFLFTFGQSMVPNYNTLGLMCVIVYSLLLLEPGKHLWLSCFLAGIFYAASVLCTPYLAFLYFFGTLILLISLIRHSEKHAYGRKAWLPFTAGAVLLAVIYVVYFLQGGSVSELIRYMLLPLQSDSTHTYTGLGPIINMLALCKTLWLGSRISTVVLPLYFILFLVVLKDRRHASRRRRSVWLLLNIVFTLLLMIGYGAEADGDYSMIALAPIGFYVILIDAHADEMLKKLWISGVLYIVMINLSSDTIIGASNHASTVSAIASILLISGYMSHTSMHLRINPKYLAACLSVLLICFEVRDKLTVIFRDSAPSELDAEITEGPVKGILTTSEKKTEYEHQLSRIQELNLDDGKKVLFFTDQSWMYLSLQNSRYGVYSTWMKPEKEEFLTMLGQYYEEFPDQIPDAAYMPAGQNGALTEEFDQIMTSCGLTLQDNSDGLYYAKSAS